MINFVSISQVIQKQNKTVLALTIGIPILASIFLIAEVEIVTILVLWSSLTRHFLRPAVSTTVPDACNHTLLQCFPFGRRVLSGFLTSSPIFPATGSPAWICYAIVTNNEQNKKNWWEYRAKNKCNLIVSRSYSLVCFVSKERITPICPAFVMIWWHKQNTPCHAPESEQTRFFCVQFVQNIFIVRSFSIHQTYLFNGIKSIVYMTFLSNMIRCWSVFWDIWNVYLSMFILLTTVTCTEYA